ncbi:hypothetical protein [Spirosoma areae]
MKTVPVSLHATSFAIQLRPHKFVGYAAVPVQIAFALLIALLAAACHHPVDPARESGTVGTPPRDSTITKPGSSTGTPSDGTVRVFKTLKIAWSNTDFQEIQFDAADKPVEYTSQYLANQGTGRVQRTVYQFLYGPDQRLNRVNIVGGGYVQYHYEGNQVARTDEYSSAGERLKLHQYGYSPTNQLLQVDTEDRFNGLQETRQTYQYDSRGNLRVVSQFVKSPASGNYALETTTHYGNYVDDGKHVENLLTTYPYLPDVTFRVSNYGTKIVRYKDGSEISRETFVYTYNEQNYPIQRVSRSAGGTLTATYSY